ncbi:hypothetical protein LINPERPRIM_LOCUS18775, partial [Linum perenne]
ESVYLHIQKYTEFCSSRSGSGVGHGLGNPIPMFAPGCYTTELRETR